MVYHCCCSRIDRLNCTSQLSQEQIRGSVESRNEVPTREIFHKSMIGMLAFQLCLIQVAMCIDETRTDDFALTLDNCLCPHLLLFLSGFLRSQILLLAYQRR